MLTEEIVVGREYAVDLPHDWGTQRCRVVEIKHNHRGRLRTGGLSKTPSTWVIVRAVDDDGPRQLFEVKPRSVRRSWDEEQQIRERNRAASVAKMQERDRAKAMGVALADAMRLAGYDVTAGPVSWGTRKVSIQMDIDTANRMIDSFPAQAAS